MASAPKVRLTHSIEITFPVGVELTQEDQVALDEIVGRICRRYEVAHPGRVMWPFGHGDRMLVNPLMLDDDEPIPFDDTIYCIEVAEREDYRWPCAKCGRRQDEHGHVIMRPKAGTCEFEPAALQEPSHDG